MRNKQDDTKRQLQSQRSQLSQKLYAKTMFVNLLSKIQRNFSSFADEKICLLNIVSLISSSLSMHVLIATKVSFY